MQGGGAGAKGQRMLLSAQIAAHLRLEAVTVEAQGRDPVFLKGLPDEAHFLFVHGGSRQRDPIVHEYLHFHSRYFGSL